MKKIAVAASVTLLLALAGTVLAFYSFPALFVDEGWIETEGRIVEVKYALEDYRADHGRYPTEEEGLAVLLQRPPEDREGPRYFIKQYVLSKASLTDTWGNPIVYEVAQPPDAGCTIYSLGRDEKIGGRGADEDIRMVCHPEL